MKNKVYIVGGGITGCSLSLFLGNDFDTTIYESNDYLGGMCRTFETIENIPYQKGPHILHTNEQWIVDFFDKFTPLSEIPYDVAINPLFDFHYYSYPFTISKNSIDLMPWHWQEAIHMDLDFTNGKSANTLPELITNFYGPTIYEQFYENWFKKQFNIEPEDLDSVDWFRPWLRQGSNTNYYKEKTYFPLNKGYNNLFDSVKANVVHKHVTFNDIPKDGTIVITGKPDVFFYEPWLEYVRLSFDVDSAQYKANNPDTIIYPNNVPFLSINQFGRYFEGDKNIVVKVYPDGDEWAYPVPTKHNYLIYNEIKKKYSDTYMIGSLGSYDFLSMADCVKQAAVVAGELKHKVRLK